MARKKKTTTKKKTTRRKARTVSKTSALEAAAKVLAEAAEPLNAKQLIERMAEKGYWTSPAGRTPSSTLSAALQREIKTKGKESRFQKTERGRFALRA